MDKMVENIVKLVKFSEKWGRKGRLGRILWGIFLFLIFNGVKISWKNKNNDEFKEKYCEIIEKLMKNSGK